MPNWCNNDVYVYGNNKAELKRFYEDVKEAERLAEETNCWFNYCLFITTKTCEGIIDKESHEIPQSFYDKGYIRGNLIDVDEIDEDNDSLHLIIESAWSPFLEAMENIIANYNDLQFVMLSVEEGGEVFVNTDKSREIYPQNYRIYCGLDDGDEICEVFCSTLEEVLKEVNLYKFRKKHNFKTIEEAIKWFTKNNGFFYLNKFEER